MQLFADEAMNKFICRVFDHVTEVFPDECRKLGDKDVLRQISDGIRRAAEYDIKIEYYVVRFIDLMFILCEDYDTNDRFPWANQILTDSEKSSTEKVDHLCERAEQELPLLTESDEKR